METDAMTTEAELFRRFVDPPIRRYERGPAGAPWGPDAPEPADLADRVDQVLRTDLAAGLHGLVVVQQGELVLERYGTGPDFSWGKPHGAVRFAPDTLHDLRSVTKSVVSLLYGIALDRGLVPAPDAPLLAQFPEYPELAGDPARAGLTVAHALTMTLGLEWTEEIPYTDPANGEIAMMLAPDRWRYVLQRPVVAPPGRDWRYCGGASELVGRLVAKGTGAPLPEFAHSALFDPLGIGTFEWLAGADGVVSCASGLRLAPRDLARIGQAVLAGGRWRDRQVLPAGWLKAALRRSATTTWGPDYGYQWYLAGTGADRWVGGTGNGNQRLYVFPERDLVVAMTAGDYDRADDSLPATLVEDTILGWSAGRAR